MKRFEDDCFAFLKCGRESGMFNAGNINLNAVLGCCIWYAENYFEFNELTLFDAVLASCKRVMRRFCDWVEEGN